MAVKMKMKTAVMTDLQKVEIQEREVPTPKSDEVLLSYWDMKQVVLLWKLAKM